MTVAPKSAVLGAVVVAIGCGRSWVDIPPFDAARCSTREPTTVGCAFSLAPSLNLTDSLGADEPDGVVVTHPGSETIEIQPFMVAAGELDETPLGTRVYLRPGARALITLPDLPRPSATARAAGGLVRVVGDGPFSAVQLGPARTFVGNDSALLLPEATQGRRYVVTTYPPHYLHFQGVGEPSYAHVLALRMGYAPAADRARPRRR